MTFTRAVFAFALLMLLVGILGSRLLVSHLLAAPPEPRILAATDKVTATGRPTATLTPTATPVPVRLVVRPRRSVTRHPIKRRIRRPLTTPTPTPTATPSAPGIVTLTRYWVGTLHARPGETIVVGYVIDNITRRTTRIMLGASLKSTRSVSWASGAINDPYHDVVALVPPGVSLHTRYFTLPRGLAPGTYDVAWGLRNAVSGTRDALVTAPAMLRVSS